ncbi:MAG: thioredoxin-dependent thiol peroxidase [Bacteroidales bacterium]|jgi:peroxiredoxin Q/BCP|nr:thioredoxin-dependent thiol peroxidase [Bacteroidales bacterium]
MLQKGDKAPVFSGTDQNGNAITLDSFKGKKVVLYFYPKDNTPGCTKEACNLRDNYQDLIDKGFAIVGVSPDSEKSHQNFAARFDLPFPLLADPKLEIIKAYGAWGEKNMYGKKYEGLLRTTFIINEEGEIDEVIKKVKTDDHTNQIFKLYN